MTSPSLVSPHDTSFPDSTQSKLVSIRCKLSSTSTALSISICFAAPPLRSTGNLAHANPFWIISLDRAPQASATHWMTCSLDSGLYTNALKLDSTHAVMWPIHALKMTLEWLVPCAVGRLADEGELVRDELKITLNKAVSFTTSWVQWHKKSSLVIVTELKSVTLAYTFKWRKRQPWLTAKTICYFRCKTKSMYL